MTEVHFIAPVGLDDPARPSGGNRYGRRVSDGLAALGWPVSEQAVDDPATLARALARIPDGALVLLDGLIASPAPEALAQLVADRLADRVRGVGLDALVVTLRESHVAWASYCLLYTSDADDE